MKKKILPVLIALILSSLTVKSETLEEVSLEISPEQETVQAVSVEDNGEKSLSEKLQDVYHLEIEQIDKPSYLLKDILTHKFDEDSAMESLQFWGAYQGDLSILMDSDMVTNHYDYSFINAGVDGKFKNNNADFRVMLGYSPLSNRNVMQNLFADVYVATNKIPHHRVMVGHMRPPVGMEGGASPYVLPYVARSQISRTFGTVRKLGAKVSGNYSLIDYDFGGYSSDTYLQEFFPGAEFVGWVNFKPLGKTDGRYGKLKIGGGLDAGHRADNFCVTGAYVGYEYKKFSADFEWAHASGYNGPSGHSSDKHAEGFYTTLKYRITPKLQILARYDEFDPDKNIGNNHKREYSAGINYFIKGQALRLILNYVFCQNDAGKDSHKIIIGTQILI